MEDQAAIGAVLAAGAALTGAVWTDESEEFALLHFQVKINDSPGSKFQTPLRQVLEFIRSTSASRMAWNIAADTTSPGLSPLSGRSG